MQNTSHAKLEETLNILVRNDSANDDRDGCVLFGQQLDNSRRKGEMGARKHREADHVNVFVDGGGRDHLWRLTKTGVDDLHAGVTQDSSHNLHTAVMTIKAHFGHQHTRRHDAKRTTLLADPAN